MSDETPETILNTVAAIMEKHNEILQSHRQAWEDIYRDLAELTKRVEKLEADGTLDQRDTELIMDTFTRLKAISITIDKKV